MQRSLVSITGLMGAVLLSGTSAVAEEQAPAANVVDLSTVEEIRRVCLATRPTSRVYFTGDAVEQGKAKQEYISARRSAMKQLYRASVPASGFKLGEYKPKDKTLELDLSRPPRTLFGALTLAVPSVPAVKFEMSPENVKAVQSAMRAGTATLVSYFELSDEQGAVCSGSAASGVFSAAVRPVAFDIRDGMGQSLGHAETPLADRYRAQLGGYSGVPTVSFGAVEGDYTDASAISRKLTPTTDALKQCYTDRLASRPDAAGTAVLGVAVLEDGRVESVSFVADAVRDEPLRKCVEDNVKKVSFAGVGGLPALFRVPVDFKLTRTK